MDDSIFTRIIKGEIPSYKIYEDEKTLALLDIHPITPGHTLVIPKVQIDHLWDLSEDDYHALMETSKKVANRIRQELKPQRVGVKVVGIDIPHAHIHLVPFNSIDEFNRTADMGADPDESSLKAIAEKLAF